MTYVRNAWYVADWTHELSIGTPMALSILDEPIVLYRNEEGEPFALEDRCVHRLAPLSLGRCEGDKIRCPYHGLLFNRDGTVAEIPGQDMIPDHARVRSYPVVDYRGWLWVWMGDPALADPQLLPPVVALDDADYTLGHGQLEYEAEARLVNDNLLDFSHLSYVHVQSFGASETWARARPRVTALPRGVRVERWITDEKRNAPGYGQSTDDGWSSYDFLIPGILVMTSASFPKGSAKEFGFGPPDMSKAVRRRTVTSQAVTPATARTARYFFSWGPHKSCGGEEMRDVLMGIASKAFAEDKFIVEAQQRVIDRTSAPRVMPTTADKALVMFNRLVERIAAEEGQMAAA